MHIFNTIALKLVKVSKLAQRKLIPHRSIIGLGHFERLNILEIFPDNYCAYRNLTIKSKLFKNMFLLSCLLSRQTESVRDHKFHSGYVIHRWFSQIGGTLFRTCMKLKSKQRESGASQSLHFSQMRSEMRLCLFI